MTTCGDCKKDKAIHCFPPCERKRPEGQKRYCTSCRKTYQEKYKIGGVAGNRLAFGNFSREASKDSK